MADETAQNGFLKFNETLGRNTFSAMETLGHWGKLLGESLFWLVAGPKLKQPVRTGAVLVQMMATTSLKKAPRRGYRQWAPPPCSSLPVSSHRPQWTSFTGSMSRRRRHLRSN